MIDTLLRRDTLLPASWRLRALVINTPKRSKVYPSHIGVTISGYDECFSLALLAEIEFAVIAFFNAKRENDHE